MKKIQVYFKMYSKAIKTHIYLTKMNMEILKIKQLNSIT